MSDIQFVLALIWGIPLALLIVGAHRTWQGFRDEIRRHLGSE